MVLDFFWVQKLFPLKRSVWAHKNEIRWLWCCQRKKCWEAVLVRKRGLFDVFIKWGLPHWNSTDTQNIQKGMVDIEKYPLLKQWREQMFSSATGTVVRHIKIRPQILKVGTITLVLICYKLTTSLLGLRRVIGSAIESVLNFCDRFKLQNGLNCCTIHFSVTMMRLCSYLSCLSINVNL